MVKVSLDADPIAEVEAQYSRRLLVTNQNLEKLLATANAEKLDLKAEVLGLRAALHEKDALIATLVARLNAKDPSLSSNPPSSVSPHARRYPKKEKSGRRPGRPAGTPGTMVAWTTSPDVIVSHRPTQCGCGHVLSGKLGIEKEARQVRDVTVTVTTTEHRVLEARCPNCRETTRGEFPSHVSARSVWGESVKSLGLLLTQRAALPTQASTDVLAALGLDVAPACLNRWRRDLAGSLTREFEPRLRVALLESPFLCFDETPINVKDGAGYVHVVSNGTLVGYHSGDRSLEAILSGEIFGPFAGVVVHDNYVPYYSKSLLAKLHQTCVAHLVRDLKLVVENFEPTDGRPHPMPWASEMLALLGRSMKERPTVSSVRVEYRRILRRALAGSPPDRKGTIESSAWNLALRLKHYESSVLRFLTKDARAINLPPTNNYAEQSVRPIKVRERRSGCFRTERGAKEHLTVQSYLRSAVNSGTNPLAALQMALEGNPWLPPTT